jgi:hypothetical protein
MVVLSTPSRDPHLASPWEGEERHGDWRCILHPPALFLPFSGGGRVGGFADGDAT